MIPTSETWINEDFEFYGYDFFSKGGGVAHKNLIYKRVERMMTISDGVMECITVEHFQ